jgi:hypothetical protein
VIIELVALQPDELGAVKSIIAETAVAARAGPSH